MMDALPEREASDEGSSTSTARPGEASVAERLGTWAAEAPFGHTGSARHVACEAVADVLVCMVAGAGDEGAARVRQAISGWGDGPASVAGAEKGASAPFAALANGTAAHALDFDDAFQQAVNHPSAVLVPALLALGEVRGASGRDLIDAYITGFEVCSGLARGIMRSHYDIGWHTTSTIGTVAAAAACGRLMRLDRTRMTQALSLSVSMAAGCKAQFGTAAKPLHAGLAAQHGIMAAQLAESGIAGRATAFEGPMGFLELYGGPSPAGWGVNLDTLGVPLAIESRGLLLKRFPCCSSAHRTVDSLLELKRETGFTAADVAGIECWVGFGNARNLMYSDPKTEFEARFSMQYCVALALLNGSISLSDFTPEAIWRPEIRALLPLTRMHAYEATDELRNTDLMKPHRIEITLRDGRILERSRAMPVGWKDDPLTPADHETKRTDCCAGILPSERMADFARMLADLEALDLRDLGQALRFEAGSDRGERFARRTPPD